MQIEKKTLRAIFWGAVGCILLYWVLHQFAQVSRVISFLWGIVSPFAVGAALAFVLNVPMRAIERKLKFIKSNGVRRGIAILLTILSLLAVLTLIFWLLIPQLVLTCEKLVQTIPDFFNNTVEKINQFLSEHPDLLNMLNEHTDFENINWSSTLEKILTAVSGGLSSVAGMVFGVVVDLSSGVVNAVLSLIFCLYALSRKEILARQGRRLLYSFLPEKACDETIRILRMANSTFSGFISGQVLEAIILGAMFAVSMTIFNMPFIPLISVVIAVTALVPIVGAFVGCILGAFLIFMQDPGQAFWFVVLFLALQQIEEHLIYPKVVGTSVGLPGMWVLVAVGVGGGLMGVAGMLIMIPLTSVLYSLAREITNKRLTARGIDPEKLKDHPPVISKFKEKRNAKKEFRLLKRIEKKLAKKTTTDKESEEETGE